MISEPEHFGHYAMFVVWRRRTKRGRQWPEDRDARLEARLVEGMRIDGKPRQRFIVYIVYSL